MEVKKNCVEICSYHSSHQDLNIVLAHSNRRWQGIADMIMAWALKKADGIVVEMWLDATVNRLPCIHRKVVNGDDMHLKEDADKKCKNVEQELVPQPCGRCEGPRGRVSLKR